MTYRAFRVVVDPTVCIGAGRCAAAVPEVFAQADGTATVVLLEEHPVADLHHTVRVAASLCPSGAITIVE